MANNVIKRDMVKSMINEFMRGYPNVSLRQLSVLNYYNENYLSTTMNSAYPYVTERTFKVIMDLLAKGKQEPEKYTRKAFKWAEKRKKDYLKRMEEKKNESCRN